MEGEAAVPEEEEEDEQSIGGVEINCFIDKCTSALQPMVIRSGSLSALDLY